MGAPAGLEGPVVQSRERAMTGVGWLHSFEGRVGICVAFIILGGVVTVVLSMIRFVLHKQTPREFGVATLILAAVWMGPALLALITVTSLEVVHRAPGWAWPAFVTGVVGGLVAWWQLRRGRAGKWRRYSPVTGQGDLQHTEHVHVPLNEPGWSLPADVEQWDR